MAGIDITSGVINYGGVPSAGAGLLANRPAAGVTGRLFIGTDTNILYRDTGSTWVTIGGTGGITGSGSAGQATFWTAASVISGDNAFFWDNTNKRLGINTTTPGVRLDVHGTGVIQQLNGTTTNNAYLDFQNAGTTQWRVGNTYNGGTRLFQILDVPGSRAPISILNTAALGAVGIFNSNPFYALHIGDGTNQCQVYCDSVGSGTGGGASYTTRVGGTTIIQMGNVSNIIGGAFDSNSMLFFANSFRFTTFTSSYVDRLTCNTSGQFTITNRLNVNNATDNSLFELNVNGNTYTGGLSPTILTVGTNTTMARTATGYYCTATLTLTLPSAASINNVYWVIAASGVTVTVNRAGSDDILNLAGTSVTSITITSNQRAMFYVGGGTRTFLIFQA